MRLKLSFLFAFFNIVSWSQSTTQTFNSNGTFIVPAGVTSLSVQAWGGGGSGGGASGAGLLLGRGAAGGGGGAYASNTISVTPSAALNIVVAGQTTGASGANGSAGGNSTITGFETSILAAGGSGGAANNAGGTPAGGAGGSAAASAGNIRLDGFPGIIGNSAALLSLLLSSGSGGAGANFGGAGGAGLSSLILGNAPGNAGSSPGGAGSGAINSALGTPQIGGAGAAGQVIVSYTCPNYSLTGVTASPLCTSFSSISGVTLNSSAVALPVGNYVVTYNRSSPSATGLTANLTVNTAGTGIFFATGLTTPGSITITVTNLASESCSSTITTNNTVTITVWAGTVGGTVTGGTTICAGNTSSLLTLSGHTGSVFKWQSAVSPFTTFTDVPNPTNSTTYTSVALTETTKFRAVVQNGPLCIPSNSESTTVTVNFIPELDERNFGFSACQSTNSQFAAPLTYVPGNANSYSINWDDPLFPDQPDTSYNFTSILGIGNLIVPANLAVGTYSGTLYFYNNGCLGGERLVSLEVQQCSGRSAIANLEPVLNENLNSAENKVSVNSLNKVLSIDSSDRNIKEVFVYDISGNLIYKKDGVSNPKVVINNLRSNNQVLVVKVVLDNNKVETKKVVY